MTGAKKYDIQVPREASQCVAGAVSVCRICVPRKTRRICMLKRWLIISSVAVAFLMGYLAAHRQFVVQGQSTPMSGAAVTGAVGNMELYGPYDVVADWPKD